MVCFVPIVCLSIRKSCQRHDCSELGIVRNWVEHCTSSDCSQQSEEEVYKGTDQNEGTLSPVCG